MKGNLFGYNERDLEIPKNLKANCANSTPIFKNSLSCKNDIGDLMKDFAEGQAIMTQLRKITATLDKVTGLQIPV